MNTRILRRWWLPVFFLGVTLLELEFILLQADVPLSMIWPFFVPIFTLVVAQFVIWGAYLQAKQYQVQHQGRLVLLELMKEANKYRLQGLPVLIIVKSSEHHFLVQVADEIIRQPNERFDACVVRLSGPGPVQIVMSLGIDGVDALEVNILAGECLIAGHRDDPLLAKLASEFELTLAFQKCGFGYCISERN